MRALILENDPAVRSALETALRDFSDCEQGVDRKATCQSFEDALASGRAFDLVVIDITPTDLQDGSIISDIRQIEVKHQVAPEKQTCLMVISASPGRQRLTDLMFKGCDEIIDKPVDPHQVLEKLIRYDLTSPPRKPETSLLTRTTAKELCNKVIKRIDRGDLELPPAPKIAMRSRQLVDLNADMDDLVEILRHDPAISAKLIRMSNSVAYGGFEKNTSINQAVHRLGMDRSVELVMCICCRSYFTTNHPDYKQLVEDLWWHSLACAHAAVSVNQQKPTRVEEDLFSLGLLHDIGKLVLLQAASNLQRSHKSRIDIAPEALHTMLSTYHGQVGTRILRQWGYAKDFTDLIQHHRADAEDRVPPAMQVLHQADLLATIAGLGYGLSKANEAAAELEQLGYPPQLQGDIKQQISAHIDQLRFKFW